MISISELRDYVIVFGAITITILIMITTIFSYVIFKRLRKVLNYIDSSISEIDSVKNKIVEVVPKPFKNIVSGALSVKAIIDSLTKKNKSKKGESKKSSKVKKNKSKKGDNNV
tara:strand:+ start:3134 stop:3472 length:339 start_codon:yes stop_codon:yes gene_type:complete